MTPIRLFIVDAFTDRPFAGNPAAVCLLDGPRDAEWMQSMAVEMNLSETAFLHRQNNDYELRWFTPRLEIDLCGHATLAAAHVLWSEESASDPIRFHTRSGVLTCTEDDGLIELDFPATPAEECQAPAGLIEALGVSPSFVGKSLFDRIIVVDSEQTVRSLTPDFNRLLDIDMRGVIVTSTSADSQFDFVSRYFAPAAGVDEDPVTGSAHCCLAPFWSERLGRKEMTGYQASSRGGVVRVRVEDDRVILGGQAITTVSGQLTRNSS